LVKTEAKGALAEVVGYQAKEPSCRAGGLRNSGVEGWGGAGWLESLR